MDEKKLEEIMEQNKVDNSRLEELMKKAALPAGDPLTKHV